MQVKPQQQQQTGVPGHSFNSSSASYHPSALMQQGAMGSNSTSVAAVQNLTGIASPPAQPLILAPTQVAQYHPFPLGASQLVTQEPRVSLSSNICI